MKNQFLFFALLGRASLIFCSAGPSNQIKKLEVQMVTHLTVSPQSPSGTAQPQAIQTQPEQSNRALREDIPIINAAIQGNDELVTTLLYQQHNPNIADSVYGTTPLIHAAARGHIAVVKTLLAMAPDRTKLLTTKCKSGGSALDYAKSGNQSKVVEFLTHVQNQLQFGPLCQTYFSPNILNAISHLITNEQQRIMGAMYSFTHGTPAKLMVEKQKAGIPTTLIINKDYKTDLCTALRYMINNGIQIYTTNFGSAGDADPRCYNMHHKFLIFGKNSLNKQLLLTGSCNFTNQGFNRNWENVIVTDNAESIMAYLVEMQKLCKAPKKLLATDCSSPKDTYSDALVRNCVHDLKC